MFFHEECRPSQARFTHLGWADASGLRQACHGQGCPCRQDFVVNGRLASMSLEHLSTRKAVHRLLRLRRGHSKVIFVRRWPHQHVFPEFPMAAPQCQTILDRFPQARFRQRFRQVGPPNIVRPSSPSLSASIADLNPPETSCNSCPKRHHSLHTWSLRMSLLSPCFGGDPQDLGIVIQHLFK